MSFNADTSWPYLTGDVPPVQGRIRAVLEDFQVDEVPAYAPSGDGDHVFFCIEKRGLSTPGAIREIARALGTRPRNIGAAGMKDAGSVSRQILSAEHVDPERILALDLPRLKVLWAVRHRNKLRTGHLKGNRFALKLRDTEPSRVEDIRQSLSLLSTRGVPNYFGAQRFGNRGDTWAIGRSLILCDFQSAARIIGGQPTGQDRGQVLRARELFDAGRYEESEKAWPRGFGEAAALCKALVKTRGDFERAVLGLGRRALMLYVSAYQSFLFNRVLAERVGEIERLETGDLAYKHTNGAVFLVEDAAMEQGRADRFEISATGPIFGERMRAPAGAVAELENGVLEQERIAAAAFPRSGPLRCAGGRRPLRFRPEDVNVRAGQDAHGFFIALEFFLPAGCYATSLLREICKDGLTEEKG